MIAQLGLRRPSVYKDPIQLRTEGLGRPESPDKARSVFSAPDYGPSTPIAPPRFEPAEVRRYSNISLDPKDWETLRKWEQRKGSISEALVHEFVSRRDDSPRASHHCSARRSSMLSVEVEHYSREYDPAAHTPPDLERRRTLSVIGSERGEDENSSTSRDDRTSWMDEDAISPKDTRRFSRAVKLYTGDVQESEPATVQSGYPYGQNAESCLPIRPGLNPFQPASNVQEAPRSQRYHETSYSGNKDVSPMHRNDTHTSGFSDNSMKYLETKTGRLSVSTSSIDKFQLESRDWTHPTRCGLLPSLPESLIELHNRNRAAKRSTLASLHNPLWEEDTASETLNTDDEEDYLEDTNTTTRLYPWTLDFHTATLYDIEVHRLRWQTNPRRHWRQREEDRLRRFSEGACTVLDFEDIVEAQEQEEETRRIRRAVERWMDAQPTVRERIEDIPEQITGLKRWMDAQPTVRERIEDIPEQLTDLKRRMPTRRKMKRAWVRHRKRIVMSTLLVANLSLIGGIIYCFTGDLDANIGHVLTGSFVFCFVWLPFTFYNWLAWCKRDVFWPQEDIDAAEQEVKEEENERRPLLPRYKKPEHYWKDSWVEWPE